MERSQVWLGRVVKLPFPEPRIRIAQDNKEDLMIRCTLLAAVVAVFATGFLSVPALAGHCPKDVKKLDAALPMSKLHKMQTWRVKGLRDKGDEQHKNGQHEDALKSLHEAMKKLGIFH